MAFDQATRNRLQRFVSDVRSALTDEFTRQLQNEYGLDPISGSATPLENLPHLDDARRETARILRDTLSHYLATSPSGSNREVLERIVREQAFTVLNRLAALRMAEARGLLIESLAQGYNSKGFQLYSRLAGTGLGETGDAYRAYLFSVFDELALDLKVLFDRFSHYGRLFPREAALLEVLALINNPEIAPLWAEDETIGWIYQYFNDPIERKKMRDPKQGGSVAPRNSRELAVRNQFFTPRYVVEFLTDNTLGRIWYEMTRGETQLKEQCRYFVRRPNEMFLAPGEKSTESEVSSDENLSQEELLRQTVYIPHRPMKDPREIRILDPACGSMHFGLYAFDLLEVIYREAWDIEASKGIEFLMRSAELQPLSTLYSNKESFLHDVPRLIVEHNLHGIDIDPRAVQIAGLSLWLRAQRSWQQQGVKAAERPQVRRSNIVCAEPMPGEESLLNEFLEKQLSVTTEERLLGQLVRRVFEEMKLAGEAGSLLKIEEEIADAVEEARQEWKERPRSTQTSLFAEMAKPEQRRLSFEVNGITHEQFWEGAEERIYKALRAYAEATEQGSYQRRLFAEDAARGFAFIDICRKRYDVVLMNPPFGLPVNGQVEWLKVRYANAYVDLYAAMVARGIEFSPFGLVGCITSRSFMFARTLTDWRETVFLKKVRLVSDLGSPVMDAAVVESCAYVLNEQGLQQPIWVTDCRSTGEKGEHLFQVIRLQTCDYMVDRQAIKKVFRGKFLYNVSQQIRNLLYHERTKVSNTLIARQGLKTFNDFRFLRLHWEVPASHKGKRVGWEPITRGGGNELFYSDIYSLVLSKEDGRQMALENFKANGQTAQSRQASRFYRLPGSTYTWRAEAFKVAALPSGVIIGGKGPAIIPTGIASPLLITSILNSAVMRALVELQANANQYETGIVESLPLPCLSQQEIADIECLSKSAITGCMCIAVSLESSPRFSSFIVGESLEDIEKQYAQLAVDLSIQIHQVVTQLDSIISAALELTNNDIHSLREAAEIEIEVAFESFGESAASNLISHCAGLCFGRWDIRFATSEKPTPELPDPFAPLPVCPPGMLQNEQGLPAEPKDVPESYPLRINWQGILVDDQGHTEDIESRIQDALHVIWKDRADAIEQEACEILGVRTLREYFRKPAAFFADHLKRYSKSRRQAPIYWPLSTKSGAYTLWLYYHRLNNQTLYSCVNDFVEPKLREVSDMLNKLRANTSRTRAEEKEFERLQDFELELQELRDELLRLAKLPWRPNLNDGVQITAAPLWKLFRLPRWQKTLKETWAALEKEDYDWAHLAMTIWPERVVTKCTKDLSLAIAHELEDLFWVEDSNRWRALNTPESEIAEQKRRQRSDARGRVKTLLSELAAEDVAALTSDEVRRRLAEGEWDDREVALYLYPQRVAEQCFADPVLAKRLNLQLPKERTKAARERFVKKFVAAGCADLAPQLERLLAWQAPPFGEFWAEVAAGKHDEQEVALSLWPDRVIDKCAADVSLAERHQVREFFWVQHPSATWRRREDPKVEVANEIARRRSAP